MTDQHEEHAKQAARFAVRRMRDERVLRYMGDQVRPGEEVFALIVIGPAGLDGKHNLILRTIAEQVDELQRQTPIARQEIYQRLRQLVEEFAMFAEGPDKSLSTLEPLADAGVFDNEREIKTAHAGQYTGSTITECSDAVERITGKKPCVTDSLEKL